MKIFTTAKLTRMGITAGLYIVLSLIVFPISSGAIQVRISEGLTLLPLIFPETAIALCVGCLLTNLITGCMLFDVLLGSVVTFIAGLFTALIGKAIKNTAVKITVGGLFPVLLNAFLLPLIWWYCYGKLDYLYIVQVALVLAGQAISVYAVGTIIYLTTKKAKDKGLKGFID